MLYIKSIDGNTYLINKECISIVKSHGNNVMIYFKNSERYIIGNIEMKDILKFYGFPTIKEPDS
ncbi:Uncharacterised protein [Klebsiella oxytoca]|nr:Uncharacterised protein [Klebsiella oxytoca]SBL64423.1 Uncharacterised protein [Klebsiella oxytoca]